LKVRAQLQVLTGVKLHRLSNGLTALTISFAIVMILLLIHLFIYHLSAFSFPFKAILNQTINIFSLLFLAGLVVGCEFIVITGQEGESNYYDVPPFINSATPVTQLDGARAQLQNLGTPNRFNISGH
jgi:hypothetical protein